ncbi:MAG: septum formation inhibitor Maf [Marinirhabdus sp.]
MKHKTAPSIAGLLLALLFAHCSRPGQNLMPQSGPRAGTLQQTKTRTLPTGFEKYWYTGTAEITSYDLKQERYGEIRQGSAVTIFVTEDFNPKKQVKADAPAQGNIPVLKLNLTKKFNTGIYPYSIMTSTFSPVQQKLHPLKITHSTQEWCGQVFMQLNNRDRFEIASRSYFEREADTVLQLKKTWLEDEFFNLIRINPEELPTGAVSVLPSFEAIRVRHRPIAAQQANASLKTDGPISRYSVVYPALQRELVVYFSTEFPFKIEKWEETNAGSTGAAPLKTVATRAKRINTAYWQQNSNAYAHLRDTLGL